MPSLLDATRRNGSSNARVSFCLLLLSLSDYPHCSSMLSTVLNSGETGGCLFRVVPFYK